jgi:hypothetical protein
MRESLIVVRAYYSFLFLWRGMMHGMVMEQSGRSQDLNIGGQYKHNMMFNPIRC